MAITMKNRLSHICIALVASHIPQSCEDGYYYKIWSCVRMSFPWTEDAQSRKGSSLRKLCEITTTVANTLSELSSATARRPDIKSNL